MQSFLHPQKKANIYERKNSQNNSGTFAFWFFAVAGDDDEVSWGYEGSRSQLRTTDPRDCIEDKRNGAVETILKGFQIG